MYLTSTWFQVNIRTKSLILSRATSRSTIDEHEGDQLYITVGRYKNIMVAIKKINKSKIDVDRALMQEMRQVCMEQKKDITNIVFSESLWCLKFQLEVLSHQNVNKFIGASVDFPHACLCWEYATKGSLNDLLWNETIQLDDIFRFSICGDVIKVNKHK